MKFILFFIVLIIPISTNAQARYDANWVLGAGNLTGDGDSLGLYEEPWGLIEINFGDEVSFSKKHFYGSMDTPNGSISSAEGELQFFGNGCGVYNKWYQKVPNSDSLGRIRNYDVLCEYNHGLPGPRDWFFLPKPGGEGRFSYLITGSYTYDDDFVGPFFKPTFLAEFDAQMHSDSGGIVSKRTIIHEHAVSPWSLSAVKHANGRDWWVVSRRDTSTMFDFALLDSTGVARLDSQRIGDDLLKNLPEGPLDFAPTGSKMAVVDPPYICLFDVDREDMTLSNYTVIDELDSIEWTDGIFSPSGRFLYVSQLNHIYQYDLEASDIKGSQVKIGEYDGTRFNGYRQRFNRFTNGPDCRIYLSSNGGSACYHVIDKPDRKGLACNFLQCKDGLYFRSFNNGSIPHIPHYRLGTPYPVCDSTIEIATSLREFLTPEAAKPLEVYPNPTTGFVQVTAPVLALPTDEIRLEIVNLLGAIVESREKQSAQSLFRNGIVELNLAPYPKGVYWLRLHAETGRSWVGKVVKQ